MKNRLMFLIVPLLLGFYCFLSCEKEAVKFDKAKALTDHIWMYDTIEVSLGSDPNFLIAAAFVHMVFKGSEFDYREDSTYTMTSPLTNRTGTWELVEDKTLLLDKDTEDEMLLEILKIDNANASFKLHLEGEYMGTPYLGDMILKFKAK